MKVENQEVAIGTLKMMQDQGSDPGIRELG